MTQPDPIASAIRAAFAEANRLDDCAIESDKTADGYAALVAEHRAIAVRYRAQAGRLRSAATLPQ